MCSVDGSAANDKGAAADGDGGDDGQLGSSISLRVYDNEDSCPTGSIDHVPLLFRLLVGAADSALAPSFCCNCCFCM